MGGNQTQPKGIPQPSAGFLNKSTALYENINPNVHQLSSSCIKDVANLFSELCILFTSIGQDI